MNPKKRILVTDDDVLVRGMLTESLVKADFDVSVVTRGDEALQVLQTKQPDLMLLDLEMPGMNGLEVLRHVRDNPFTHNLPVILLTGNTLEGDKVIDALNLDPSDLVTKLISARELVARIRWVLRRSD